MQEDIFKIPCDHYILNDNNEAVKAGSLGAWAQWFEKANRTLARYDAKNAFVSTVFLGIDHRFYGEGDPIVFETMVFGSNLNQRQWRYDSYERAMKGHRQVRKMLKKAVLRKMKPGIKKELEAYKLFLKNLGKE